MKLGIAFLILIGSLSAKANVGQDTTIALKYLIVNKCTMKTGEFFKDCENGEVKGCQLADFLNRYENNSARIEISLSNTVVVSLINAQDTLVFYDINKATASYFLDLLSDNKRDWLANLFLYAIYERSAFELIQFKNDALLWKRAGKQNDVAQWNRWKKK